MTEEILFQTLFFPQNLCPSLPLSLVPARITRFSIIFDMASSVSGETSEGMEKAYKHFSFPKIVVRQYTTLVWFQLGLLDLNAWVM